MLKIKDLTEDRTLDRDAQSKIAGGHIMQGGGQIGPGATPPSNVQPLPKDLDVFTTGNTGNALGQ